MNILIPDSWLKEHLETKASVNQIAEYLSLCSQSVERIHDKEDDSVYEIEITTNRSDCLSVVGIARELNAILPNFKISSKLHSLPSENSSLPNIKNSLPLDITITDKSLCPRFTAIIFDGVSVYPSPKIVQERLEKSGIRALNNVVDISNYLMLELGQPMHTFDYDKIGKSKMVLRESKTGEFLVTLDSQKRELPKGTIVIEDGDNRIIDLCGIMGGENSAVDQNTKRVLLFVQTYDPIRIRKTCQSLGFRTDASSRFEKGVDPEGVLPAIKRAVQLFERNCSARVAGKLIDIYPNPPTNKTVQLPYKKLTNLLGVEIKINKAVAILERLGFRTSIKNGETIISIIPHWRNEDISIPEDLIEEIARIYGYFNLPASMLEGQIPSRTTNTDYDITLKIKNALKYWGFTEIYSYSLIGIADLDKINMNPDSCLKISNPISEDWMYLRPTLIPSILKAVAKNQNESPNFSLFEIANIYIPNGVSKLPQEIPFLSGIMTDSDYYKVKGVIEALLRDLGISDYEFRAPVDKSSQLDHIFQVSSSADLLIGEKLIGRLGILNKTPLEKFGIKIGIGLFYLNQELLINHATNLRKFSPLPKNPPVIEDLAFVVKNKTLIGEIIHLIKSCSNKIYDVQLLDIFEFTKTIRITYLDPEKTLTDTEVGLIRRKIIESLKKTFGISLKSIDPN